MNTGKATQAHCELVDVQLKSEGITKSTGLYCFLISFTYLFALFASQNIPEISPLNLHFGAEYGHIAAALVQGEGYSNAFGTDSGPTAWMTPLYPLLMSGIFKILGIKSLFAAWVLLTIKYASLSICAVLLLDISYRHYKSRHSFLVVVIYLGLLTAYFWTTFLQLHDIWLLTLASTLVIYCYAKLQLENTQPGVQFGLLGGFVALAHPVVGFAFAALVMTPGNGFRWKGRITAGVISMLVISPWVVRNYVTFDQLIPLKSNVSLDAYQGSFVSDSGILNTELFMQFHPYFENSNQAYYTKVGEKEFLNNYKTLFGESLRENPSIYMERTLTRLMASTIYPSEVLTNQSSSLIEKTVKTLLYLLPVVAIVFWLCIRNFRSNYSLMLTTALYCVFYLLPFILIGFYFRYRLPLIPVFSLMIYMLVAYTIDSVFKSTKIKENDVRST